MDGDVIAGGKTFGKNILYAVKPGTHKILVKFYGSSLLAIVANEHPGLSAKIKMVPGSAYLAAPRVYAAHNVGTLTPYGFVPSGEESYSLGGGIFQVKQSVIDKLKKEK